MANPSWQDPFLLTWVRNIPRFASNHGRILLDPNEEGLHRHARRRFFPLEYMWQNEGKCENVLVKDPIYVHGFTELA